MAFFFETGIGDFLLTEIVSGFDTTGLFEGLAISFFVLSGM